MDGKGGSMEIKGKLDVERVMVGSKSCILHSNCDGVQPKVVFLQLTARHEAKSLPDELTMLDEGITRPYLFVGIELDCWARCLMPWFDDAVSRDEEWANTLLTHCVILRTHWCLGFIRGMVMCHVLLAGIRLGACSHCGHRAKQTSS